MISWNSISESCRWKCDGKPARRRRTSAFSARKHHPVCKTRPGAGPSTTALKSRTLHWESWLFPANWLLILLPAAARPMTEHPCNATGCLGHSWLWHCQPWALPTPQTPPVPWMVVQHPSHGELIPSFCVARAHCCCWGCCSRADWLLATCGI